MSQQTHMTTFAKFCCNFMRFSVLGTPVLVGLCSVGCGGDGRSPESGSGEAITADQPQAGAIAPGKLVAVEVGDSVVTLGSPFEINAARHEWAELCVRVPAGRATTLAVSLTAAPGQAPAATTLPASQPVDDSLPTVGGKANTTDPTTTHLGPVKGLRAYRIVSRPVDTRSVAYQRAGGRRAPDAGTLSLPRVLVPLAVSADGVVNVNGLAGELIWLEWYVPDTFPAGASTGQVTCGDESIAFTLSVWDFAISDQPAVAWVGELNWAGVQNLLSQAAGVNARLVSRDKNPGLVNRLDSLITQIQQHGLSADCPELRPVTKWPSGEPPQVDFAEFDSVAGPWLSGELAPGGSNVGLIGWRLPVQSGLEKYDATSRRDYWRAVAGHFDQKRWLTEAVAATETDLQPLTAHPKVTVEREHRSTSGDSADRVLAEARFHAAGQPSWVDARATAFTGPWDADGLVSTAFTNSARWIRTGPVLDEAAEARTPDDPAHPIWFYPGRWYDRTEPVPGIDLKWARRSAALGQYLQLLANRGQADLASEIASKLSGPAVQDGVPLRFTAPRDEALWNESRLLLAKLVMSHRAGGEADPVMANEAQILMARWRQRVSTVPTASAEAATTTERAPAAVIYPMSPAMELKVDGRLDEWGDPALIFSGDLIGLADRQTLLGGKPHSLQSATGETSRLPSSRLWAAYDADGLVLAFDLMRPTASGDVAASNFIKRDAGRISGEDAAEFLISPGRNGPSVVIVLKPNGAAEVEMGSATGWKGAPQTGLIYAARMADRRWQGEVRIPWSTLQFSARPESLGFNITQSFGPTGVAGSWAGPVWDGRDARVLARLKFEQLPATKIEKTEPFPAVK